MNSEKNICNELISNYHNIYKNLLLSKVSYFNPIELTRLSNNPTYISIQKNLSFDLPLFISCNDTDAQCYIWKENETMYIIFRGTSSFKDLYLTSHLSQTNITNNRNAKVHSGLYKQYKSIETKILNNITTNIKYINVSGHNTGGAIATICSAIIGDLYKNIEVSCYTFGCPRVGNMEFKKYYQNNVKKSYRIVNKRDPVCMLPINSSYEHVCDGFQLDKNDNITRIKDVKWYFRIFNIFIKIDDINIYKYHDTSNYITRLCNIYIKRNI